MQTLQEIGEAVATRRRGLGLKQVDVAAKTGVSAELLSRFERGRGAEFGTRKLLAVLAVLGAELEVVHGRKGAGPARPARACHAGVGVARGVLGVLTPRVVEGHQV